MSANDTLSQCHDDAQDADFSAHIPVLLNEVLEYLNPQAHGRFLDGTLGLAGHSSAILARAGEGAELCGLDRDNNALDAAKRRLAPHGDRVHLYHQRYADFCEALDDLGWHEIDGALIDIGVSSMQIDTAERGFSFHADGPLDMRMDATDDRSAWHYANRERFEVLKDIITRFGEEPMAGRIARAIVDARNNGTIDNTLQLASIVEMAYPAKWRAKARNHPATRTFQAIRMAVNDELGQLDAFLDAILPRIKSGGRLAVITFHSLEDRAVKHRFRYWAEGCRCPKHIPYCVCGHKPEVRILTKKPVTASAEELARNPRASSAKLRVMEKI
ncbi:MAG: 16S rRNA (cytosine(1402)-N(4))-methyltransferase RsmH [Pseudomonadota bacterium]